MGSALMGNGDSTDLSVIEQFGPNHADWLDSGLRRLPSAPPSRPLSPVASIISERCIPRTSPRGARSSEA